MRILTLAIMSMVTGLTSEPAQAQKYGGNAPVCLHKYYWNGGDNFDCSYTTMAQCAGTAAGLPATCEINPYYANARAPTEPNYRRPRRAY